MNWRTCSPSRLSGIGRNVVKLIDRDQPIVEGFHAELLDREAERGVRADEHLVGAVQKLLHRFDLAAVVVARALAEIPLRLHFPVRPEAELRQRFVVKARADRSLRHDDDRLLELLILQLIEGDEHQRAALAGRRRRFDEQVLLAALLPGALLHRAHAEAFALRRTAVVGIFDGDGGNGRMFHGALPPALVKT